MGRVKPKGREVAKGKEEQREGGYSQATPPLKYPSRRKGRVFDFKEIVVVRSRKSQLDTPDCADQQAIPKGQITDT